MKSIIMTAQDARELANLGGLTVTKPIKPAPPAYVEGARIVEHSPGEWLLEGPDGAYTAEECGNRYTPPVHPGDAVFIREPWHYRHELNSDGPDEVTLASELSPEEAKGRKWASPVSMPEDAARRFARVVFVGTAYGPGVTPVWLVELEVVDKAAAVAIDAGLPFSTADDPEEGSDYFTYAGDMTPEDHERMIAAIDADRAHLAEVQDRIIGIAARRLTIAEELPEAMNEPRTPETKTSRADALHIEDAALADELDELTIEENNIGAALEDAGAPVQTVEERARERLDALEKRSLEIAHSIADTRAADAFGTPAELSETREALTREAERITEEEREIAAYLSTLNAQPEDPAAENAPEGETAAAEDDEEVGSFTLGKCKYCGREWGVTLEGAKGGGYPTQRTADAAATRVCDCEEAVNNRAAIVGVALAVTRGACQYCDQLQEVGPHPSQAAADETASEVCNCPRARDERRVRERAEDARERVERLFGDSAEELGFKPVADAAVHLLESVVEMIARGPISSASLNIRGQCKAKFSVTSKGKIKVSRSETRSCDLEAGE